MGRKPDPNRRRKNGVGPIVAARLREIYPGLDDKQIAADLNRRGHALGITTGKQKVLTAGTLSGWSTDRVEPKIATLKQIARCVSRPATWLQHPVQPQLEKAIADEPDRVTTGVGRAEDGVTRPVAAPDQTAESPPRESIRLDSPGSPSTPEALVSHYHENPLVLAAMAISAREGVTKDILTELANALDSEWDKVRRGLHPGNTHRAPS